MIKSFPLVLAITVLLSLQCGSKKAVQEQIERPPNIIYIMADDLGYADLGCYGQEEISTPNIDRLAEEGIRYTQVYTGSTVCAPSRSVLMTGQHLGHTTVRGNSSSKVRSESNPQGRVPLLDEDITIAEVLKKAGYVTGITGKWGLGEPGTSGIPNNQGFDEWFGYLNQRHAHSYYPEYLWKNTTKVELEENQDGDRETYSHDIMTDFALDFIEKHQDTTFFLYIPYTIPHDKYEVPDYSNYAEESWTETEKIFAAMVSRMDKDVGHIRDLLEKLRIANNTVLFFCSDNGAAQRWEGVFDSSGHLRGRKRDMYEGGIRTPMIVWYPQHVQPKLNTTDVWYFADVMPTLSAIGGLEPPEGIDGINVWPSIVDGEPLTNERFLYWEFYEGRFGQAVRWKSWKAVKNDVDLPWELYDLASDPSEKMNIVDENPAVIEIIAEWVSNNRVESPYWESGL